jgi:hypothetical protein
LEHYHTERPHQGLENRVSEQANRQKAKNAAKDQGTIPKLGDIKCRKRLGGLLKSYSRAALRPAPIEPADFAILVALSRALTGASAEKFVQECRLPTPLDKG